ncbi:secreted effector protein PipB [bacterium BMS3Abin13]|nr:secreted effector protein PipB [bacterium BMS3Abin13]
MNRSLIAGILFCFILTGCGPVSVRQLKEQDHARQLTPDQVLKLVDGNTLLLESFKEDSYYFFDHSGRVFGADNQNNKDTGRWDVSDKAELCMRLDKWWYSYQRCFLVYADGSRYKLARDDGLIMFTATRYEGDYKSLYHKTETARKFRRRSIRHRAAIQGAAQQTPAARRSAAAATPPAQPAVAEPLYPASARETDMKPTVKWLAKDCPDCNLANSDLRNADLITANLRGANLRGADMSRANLRRADLQGANLANANLTYANLPGANLKNCNLQGANLKGANLIQADLTGADLGGANLDGALLEGVRGLNKQSR